MELGARIAHWRKHKGLTQRVLADAAGVTVSAVSLWEKPLDVTSKKPKNSRPSQASLEAVVSVLGLTMARFYGPLPKLKIAA